jgi:hypothetical protein
VPRRIDEFDRIIVHVSVPVPRLGIAHVWHDGVRLNEPSQRRTLILTSHPMLAG